MRLSPGVEAPAVEAQDFLGDKVSLKALRGQPVLLSFYRYASCPLCNLRTHELIQAWPRLSEAGLQMLAVFQSPAERMREYVGRQDAPFPLIPDPEMKLYKAYGVETRMSGMLAPRIVRDALKAHKQGFASGKIDGPMHRIPADFLIDGEGRIQVAYYGSDIGDHLPLADIERWLEAQPAATAEA